ncbi:uncharacterized protein Z518_03281 [Rhinocladiella mackenziei CBS 650.93]|uniref:Beta-lactamase-related domain-containing protein n=1 Tax=Rhinocladiella mackenziei CBS 650.93 TaxID=1442369 RepID=A0A0D2JGZ8_9EURO|nr:uncharacterized protein Z518_03281 [Rhinocladiella mackenziei CBS 650.93]KIX08625.1 hypothetical protein Z518_03281 [Rhinocladiella mackenziei CBS 650.93]
MARNPAGNAEYDAQVEALGMPPVPAVNGSHCQGRPDALFPCDRESFFLNLLARHPVVAPFHTPVYTNLAYQLFAYALENMTSSRFPALVNATFRKLDLNSTYYSLPSSSESAVIPINETASWYSVNIRSLDPGGGYYSTVNDMRKFGLSILNSTILPVSMTRRWLKPHSFTPDDSVIVGAPWEIISYPPMDRFPTRIYSKAGDLGLYSSMMGLIPDYDVGFTVLTAGGQHSIETRLLSDLISSMFIPALKQAARIQTQRLYAGRYADESTNSSLQLSVQDQGSEEGGSYLKIDQWIFNGMNMIEFIAQDLLLLPQTVAIDLSLFPTGLIDAAQNGGDKLVSWRGTFNIISTSSLSATSALQPFMGPFSNACGTWGSVDGFTYGARAFDEILFRVDPNNGTVLGIDTRVLQQGFLDKMETTTGGNSKAKRDVRKGPEIECGLTYSVTISFDHKRMEHFEFFIMPSSRQASDDLVMPFPQLLVHKAL